MASNSSEETDLYLFDLEVLTKVDISKRKSTLPPGITPLSPGEGLRLRPLSMQDYDKGYMDLLSGLTKVGEVSREMYEAQFRNMKESNNTYYIAVIEDIPKCG